MYTIESENLKVEIDPKGAELSRIYHKQYAMDYLWNADPAFWAKKSPVLFPIVGTLKNDTYYYQDKPYKLPRHGFARDMTFELVEEAKSTIILRLKNSQKTLAVFPFSFVFDLIYTVIGNRLEVTYSVKNTGTGDMFFSVGGHPAFTLPLEPGLTYEDYHLEFNRVELKGRWPISKEGLIESEPVLLLHDTNRLPLSKSLFMNDAIVFKHLDADRVSLLGRSAQRGLDFDFSGFPFLGLWAAKGANFLCIEPWCGIADSVDTDQQLEHKEGINQLAAGDLFLKTWKVSFF